MMGLIHQQFFRTHLFLSPTYALFTNIVAFTSVSLSGIFSRVRTNSTNTQEHISHFWVLIGVCKLPHKNKIAKAGKILAANVICVWEVASAVCLCHIERVHSHQALTADTRTMETHSDSRACIISAPLKLFLWLSDEIWLGWLVWRTSELHRQHREQEITKATVFSTWLFIASCWKLKALKFRLQVD